MPSANQAVSKHCRNRSSLCSQQRSTGSPLPTPRSCAAAAVLGAQFDAGLLQRAAGRRGHARRDGLVPAQRLHRPDGHRPAFRARAQCETRAYEGLSFRRRKELHGRAAAAIEARTATPEEAAELLSLHWLHAEGYEQAWHYSRLAGERARSLWANADAATFYARALEAARRMRTLPSSEVSAVAEALGDACELTGNYDSSRQAYSRGEAALCRRGGPGESVAQDRRAARAPRSLSPGTRVLHAGAAG